MHIVILDGHTTNPGDLSWDSLKALAKVEVYERTKEEELESRIKNADILITNKTPLKAKHFDMAPKLIGISVLASGYDVVDIEAAAKRNIPVSNVPGYSTESVSQHVFALLLSYSNRVCEHNLAIKAGKWSAYPDFSMQLGSIHELKGKTMGILGFGTIGKEVALIAQAFGMKVLFYSRNKQAIIINDTHQVDFETLLGESDIISLHMPLNKDSRELFNAENLKKVKRGCILINTARGPIVNEADLVESLKSGHLQAYLADVSEEEPPRKGSPLFELDNVLFSPHIAWASKESRKRLIDITVQNVQAFIDGEPQNVVN